jgi:hypothetical protein
MKYEHSVDHMEFADTRKRQLSPAQRRRFAEALRRAKAEGRLKSPMKVSTAELLLDAVNK